MKIELVGIASVVLLFFTPFVLSFGGSPTKDQRALERLKMLGKRSARKVPSTQFEALWKEGSKDDQSRAMKRLRRVAACTGLDLLITRSGSTVTPLRVVVLCVGLQLATASSVAFIWRRWWLALLASCLAGYLPIYVLRARAARRVQVMDAALPQVADLLSRALRAGQSLPSALSIVAEQGPGTVRAEFGEVFRQQKFGSPLHEAFLDLLRRIPSHELKLLATGILIQRDTGGNLTQILDKISAVVRDRIKIEGDIRVQTAQGRLTGWILCLLPITLLILMKVLNPVYLQDFYNDTLGRICLWSSFALLGCGALIIKHLVRRIEI